MDYKKKYEHALANARQEYNTIVNVERKKWLEELFPELKETENEKIKRILHSISSKISFHLRDIFTEEEFQCFDTWSNVWLEKQDEKLPVGFYYVNSEGKKFYSDTFKYGDVTLHVEKQDEQKSTDEPKFKVGDWIIRSAEDFKHNTYLITEVKDYYVCEELKGRQVTFTFNDVHKNFKLWDISDAKDGDVLAEDTCTFIIKKLNHNLTAEIYCCLYDDGDFELNSNLGFDDTCTYPATKEQRDILFQKMKERGYEWDVEKKELKNIHVIDEGKAEMDYCFTKMMNGEKVSSTWSKEDEEFLRRATNAAKDVYPMTANWLKSLKEKIGG